MAGQRRDASRSTSRRGGRVGFACLGLFALFAIGAVSAEKKPNIIVLIVDDLDNGHMASLDYMPFVQKRLVKGGTSFENAVVTTALCCPTRTTFLTGLLAHNSNSTSTMHPHGGYDPFFDRGLVKDYLPLWLRDAGYRSHFIGKLVNGVTTVNYMRPLPGWDTFDVMLLPYLYDYFNAAGFTRNTVFSLNGMPPRHYRGQYQTDVITKKVLDVLASTPPEDPFFIYIAPGATHSTFKFPAVKSELFSRDPFLPYEALGLGWTKPIPAPRHAHLFPDAKIPRAPSFDPEVHEGKPSWHAKLKRKTQKQLDDLDEWYRARLRTLQAVDEQVEHIHLALERMGKLEDTYFVLLSDNGYHLGHMRLGVGKATPYETDIRIPFLVSGPGVAKGAKRDDLLTAADLAPTILGMAGAEARPWMDGKKVDVTENGASSGAKSEEAFLVEYWDIAADEGANNIYWNNMYKSVRLISARHNLFYAIYCTNETEFYDLAKEPWQLINRAPGMDARLKSRLEALVRTMRECKGKGCIDPWSVIHPDGSVRSLDDALDPVHDALYDKIKPFRYLRCLRHFSPKNENVRKIPDEGNHPPPLERGAIDADTGDLEWTLVSDPKVRPEYALPGPRIPLLDQTHGTELDSHSFVKPLLKKPKGNKFGFLDIPGYLFTRAWQATTMSAWNGITGAFMWYNNWEVSD